MAPTEVLAEQHYLNVANLLSGLAQPAQDTYSFSFYVDPHPRPVSVGLLMGSTRPRRGGNCTSGPRWDAGHPHRHPRRDPAGSRPAQPGVGCGRRATPVRGAAAGRAARKGWSAPPAGHVGYADPPYPGANDLRRPGGVDHPRAAVGPPTHRDATPAAGATGPGGGVRGFPGGAGAAGLCGLPAHRRVRGDPDSGCHRGVRPAADDILGRLRVG